MLNRSMSPSIMDKILKEHKDNVNKNNILCVINLYFRGILRFIVIRWTYEGLFFSFSNEKRYYRNSL